MAPTCASNSSHSEEETSKNPSTSAAAAAAYSSSSSNSANTPPSSLMVEELLDTGPFFGMFDRDADEDDLSESSWAQLRLSSFSTRAASIPEASETFHKVMQQLDGICEESGPASGGIKKDKAAVSAEHKSSAVVKKAASFSASDSTTSSSSSSTKDNAAVTAETKRRRSMPCMTGGKHVQWADEAGVANLVSVRLIRPRLQARGDKEEAQASAPRSILKRLTGIH